MTGEPDRPAGEACGAGQPPCEPERGQAAARTAEEIQEWIVQYLAKVLEKPPEEIDVTIPFDDFALDSATAISMTGDLEDWLGSRVDPTLVYDYPTIERFSECLARGGAEGPTRSEG